MTTDEGVDVSASNGTRTKMSAKETITNFLSSGEAGIKVEMSRNTLTKAAEDLFTAKGNWCPVMVIDRNGETYLINRDMVNG
jgi:hypothetical protein